MIRYSTLFLLLLTFGLSAQSTLGIFDAQADVGNPKMKGSSSYDPSTQAYTLRGGGYNIWYNRDEFHFLYKKIKGDFVLTANFALIGNEDGNGHRKTGWIIRETTDADAVSVNTCVHGDGLAVLQWRALRGAYMRDPEEEIFFPKQFYTIIQLERIGKRITMRLAHEGEPLQEVSSVDLPNLRDEVLVGPYALAHDPDDIQEARVWNVRIDRPVPNEFNPNPLVKVPPYSMVPGSRLEKVEVATGKRTVLTESPERLGSPSWIPGGQKIVFSKNQSLYSLGTNGGAEEKFGSVTLPVNDGIGFSTDNKQLFFTTSDDPASASLFVVPLSGGAPKKQAEKIISGTQSISVNGKEFYFAAKRNGTAINIYKASADGKETQLTSDARGFSAGAEASRDGKYVYYHSNRSGTVQIWRMKSDGSEQIQLTFDQYHNWYPHISPDGKWIAYLSMPESADPKSLTSYKNATLKLIPTTLGGSRVLAYLMGGQGSFNSPAWSPDSKSLVFVSYY